MGESSIDPNASVTPQPVNPVIQRSGGVNLEQAETVTIDGSVIGRDNIGSITIINGPEAHDEAKIPHQVPHPIWYYTPRPPEEKALRTLLVDPDESKSVIVVYGLPGTGKTPLVAAVVGGLPETDFPEGIFWGNLESHEARELLWSFTNALDHDRQRSASSDQKSTRDEFWRMLENKRALVVLDNVKDSQQLEDMLPPDLGHNRVLAISAQRLTGLKRKCSEQNVGPLRPEECLALFGKVLGEQLLNTHKDQFREIGERLARWPQAVANAALYMVEGNLSPNAYLRMLRDQSQGSRLRGQSMENALAVAVAGLSAEQVEVFESIGVLGDGDWHYAMLAAVTLRPPIEVVTLLEPLVRNGLVESAGHDRYRVNSIIRDYVQQRVATRSAYARQAAHHLLGRYCLDLAQDLDASLRQSPEFRGTAAGAWRTAEQARRDRAFALAFREGLLPEMPHVRKVLDWAVSCENWDLIRRFSYLPYMGMVHNLVARRARLIRTGYTMAILRSPVLVSRGEPCVDIAASVGETIDWLIDADQPREDGQCDLEMDLAASRLYDGIFDRVNFVDTRWTGVRAGRIILKHCDLVGGRFIACDMNRSVWLDCDVRRADLSGSRLRYALLKDVNLRGANLRGIDLSGTALDNVDLRGADLAWANLSSARLKDVNLTNCNLDHVRWDGSVGYVIMTDEANRLRADEIKVGAQESAKNKPEEPYGWRPDSRHLASQPWPDQQLDRADLRGVNLAYSNLARARLQKADLRGANLKRAELKAALLNESTLRGADLIETQLESADMTAADLRGADLSRANLIQAKLIKADLFAACLSEAHLAQADLSDADLSQAFLKGADLSRANLTSANLSGASCPYANFTQALVTEAQLARASNLDNVVLPSGESTLLLQGTSDSLAISPETNLRFASFDGTFSQVSLSHRQLFGAHLRGTFDHIDFSGSDLSYARLTGTFSALNLRGARLNQASLDGTYADLDLGQADLTDAKLSGTLAIARMRGATLPDGTRYDGRYNCPGDLEDARTAGIDANDSQAMAQFYQAAAETQ